MMTNYSKPQITSTTHVLPFGALSPSEFERMCLWLAEREGYLRAEHLGEAGNENGRDILAYRNSDNGQELWYFQCKRYATLHAKSLMKEVEKYNVLSLNDPEKKPYGIVFLTNATISARAREEVRKFCADFNYTCEFWARTELDLRIKKHNDIIKEFFNYSPLSLGQNNISISHLPVTGSDLFGREKELRLLDKAWTEPTTNVISFVAWGGVGKTTLINYWLRMLFGKEEHRGAERIYAWSFYMQGTDRALSADLFIDSALRHFGDTDPLHGSPWDKGERLAHLIRASRTLLILDGLEPLQYPPGPQEGRIKDPGIQALLRELAAYQPGLCIVSSRIKISDLEDFKRSTVIQKDLDHLSPRAGAKLLRARGVIGTQDELEQTSREFGGHSLALTLLGSYLSDVYSGDVRRRREIGCLEEDVRHGGHAQRVMRSYETWLGTGSELSILRILGLFDRPADSNAMHYLLSKPAIVGLTDGLQEITEVQWQQTISKLRRIKLLSEQSVYDPGTLDTHPLVREYFRRTLKTKDPVAWREGNNRLCEHMKECAGEHPETIEDMLFLYAAIAHGCEANRHQEMLNDIYISRIQRGDESFSIKKLGLFNAEIATLRSFFTKSWRQPVSSIDVVSKALVSSDVGFDLQAMGRLNEATEPLQVAVEIRVSQEDWKNAAISAENLSRLYLMIGDMRKSLLFAKKCVETANKSGDIFQRTNRMAMLAYINYQTGRMEKAKKLFREAENLQLQWQPGYKYMYSIRGFRYCEFLLGKQEYTEVIRRVHYTLDISTRKNWSLDIALDNISLGRAYLLQEKLEVTGNWSDARTYLSRAVNKLREIGRNDYLPLAIIARAELFILSGEYLRAKTDLDEAFGVATRCEMGQYEADCRLQYVNFFLRQGDLKKARSHYKMARKMIEDMGYHRYDKDIADIERLIKSTF